jgi:hypothetical protein
MRSILSGGLPHIPVKRGEVVARFKDTNTCLDFCDAHPECYPDCYEGDLPFVAVRPV